MSQTGQRGGGRWMLAASLTLFVLFALLTCYHKYYDALNAYFSTKSDASLLAELDSATILDEPETLGGGWPQWRGVRRDGVTDDRNLQLDWPKGGPTRLWTIEAGKGYSSFAVFGNRAYTMMREGDQEIVVCLDLADEGKRLWEYPYSCTFTNGFGDGPRSTPTLDREPSHAPEKAVLKGDRLYTVGVAGQCHCLDAVSGKEIWQKDLLGEYHADNLQWGIAFSPLIEGDLVITTPGGPNASIVAFNKYTGEQKWATQSDKAGYSSPMAVDAAGRRQILVFTAKGLVSVAPEDGSLLWRFEWETSSDVNAATPVVFHAKTADGKLLDYVFITSGYQKGSALLKMTNDEQGKPAAQVVYSGKISKVRLLCSQFSSPVRRGDYLFGFNDADLRCINLKTGNKEWELSGFHKGSLLRVGERLLVLGETGNLVVLPATPDADPQELAKAKPFARDSHCWTMPVVADGRLLLRASWEKEEKKDEISCFDLRQQK